jgi:glycosyltransferase involved in cell wall biosynthesis
VTITPKRKKIRSLWGTTPILSIVNNAEAERFLGIDSETLVFETYFITDRFTHNLEKFCKNRLLNWLTRILAFPWALFNYSIFHYFCDRGILPTRNWKGIPWIELFLLHLFKKKVFVYTYGGDVRTRKTTLRLGKYNCCRDCQDVGKACVCSEEKQQSNHRRILKYSTEVFSMGDMLEYTPGSNNGLFYWPIDISKLQYVRARTKHGGGVRIVHAPNHRQYKGTKYLLDAVRRLGEEGYQIELDLVEKVPNERALQIYRQADIVAEQFLIGWHGMFALEAMALGKPVICYIRKREYLLAPDECPIVSANPETLADVIEELIKDPEKRERLGEMGREYVKKYFSLEAFAKRLGEVYKTYGIL